MPEPSSPDHPASLRTIVLLYPTPQRLTRRFDAVILPTPADDDQQYLLQTVWDLFVVQSRWPTFAQVDRKLDQESALDVQEVSQRLPAELLSPRMDILPTPEHELRLTVAGAVACSGSQEDVRYFLEVVRFAAELERSWPGRPTEETDEPIMKSADVDQQVQFPAAGREALLTRLGLLLANERWGWQSAGAGRPDWQFVLSRQVRRFRAVRDLDQYWSIRTDQTDQTKQTEQASPSPPGEERGSMATADKIFISHASADRELADLLPRRKPDAGLAGGHLPRSGRARISSYFRSL